MTTCIDILDVDSSLSTAGLLAQVVRDRRTADRAEADLLAHVAEFADAHPVWGDVDPAAWDSHERRLTGPDPASRLAGEGTPQVAEYAVVELAAALGISYLSGLALVAQVLELRHRLPRLWALVHDGALQAWRAKSVAQLTPSLEQHTVDYVDRHAAILSGQGRLDPTRVKRLIETALVVCEPEKAEGLEEAAAARQGVWFEHSPTGLGASLATTKMSAVLDGVDALVLDETLTALAAQAGRLGDTSSLDHRRADALALLARPQRALDLFAGDVTALTAVGGPAATLYLHVDADDLEAGAGGTVERLGAGSLTLLTEWLATIGTVRVQPVLDLGRGNQPADCVDRHDPPAWMRELVILRDRTCVFPGCSTDARRCDLDHLTPYRDLDDPDDPGPPGQTNPLNLAPLCRRHHRAKTHGRWGYTREPDGYRWTTPTGLIHLVPHLH
jgi:hypothetical protein